MITGIANVITGIAIVITGMAIVITIESSRHPELTDKALRDAEGQYSERALVLPAR